MAALNRGIIESVGHGLIAVDREGTVLCFNPAARVYLREEQTGRHFDRVISPDLAPTMREILEKLERGTDHEALSVEFTASDGQVFPLTISSTPLQLNEEDESGWGFVIKDSTHRVEVEHLKQYEALKSDFLLGLIHDMKTPLTGIVSGCEIMMEEPGLDDEQIDTLKIIHASAGCLQELATDSLEISALESAATDDPMEPTDLEATLAPVLDVLRLTAVRHEILFEAPKEPLVLYCQPRRIARVLQNLVSNAIKYSPSGGTIHVRLDRTETSVRLSVSDEGIGIKQSELPSIWKRFHRSSAEGIKQIEGTGLGLSIIKMIVDKHHGRVQVESEPGRGSTFAILLPILTAPQTVEIH
jgi:two-component system phosphate regulon sensor histidine kinase PhoR